MAKQQNLLKHVYPRVCSHWPRVECVASGKVTCSTGQGGPWLPPLYSFPYWETRRGS